MFEDNVKLSKLIENSGCKYTYVTADGEHNWTFWDKHIQNALKWLLYKELK